VVVKESEDDLCQLWLLPIPQILRKNQIVKKNEIMAPRVWYGRDQPWCR